MRIFIIISIILSTQSFASNNLGCAKVGASMYIDLTDAIVEDLKIPRNQISRNNVSVEIISLSPISKVYAEQLAEMEFKHQTTNFLRKNDYARIFYDDDVKIIVAKYTYRNAKNQKNVFIASSLKNKYECSIRFNGYLIVEREF
ncbi:Shiga toxin A subunit [Tatumella ptyseos]|uniref:Shiga toxin A subunit n=1 Tax=Tatumella ptyseos TaxID=82987 RepID=UPI0026E99081|nr:Shiga toxin A subunit [Tatumella ptyseos]WKX26189.1 Shiga toxin A subunit [Tatumella ptyseos]